MNMVNTDVAKSSVTRSVVSKGRAGGNGNGKVPLLAVMSHELRSPLGAILGLLDLALGEELTPDVRDYLQTARESSKGLLELLDKSLDLFRIGSGSNGLESIPFNVRQVMDETTKSMHLMADEKGLRLACVVEPDVPDRLLGDPVRLRQVLVNLVSNAIKFTDEGQVALHAALQTRNADRVRLTFRVVDTGIGVSPEDQAQIFLPFIQARAQGRGRGSGLGLAIARGLVKSMGGRIGVDSRLGAGSDFHFALPFKLPQ